MKQLAIQRSFPAKLIIFHCDPVEICCTISEVMRHLSLAGRVPGPDKPFPDQVEYIEFRDSIMYLDGQICKVVPCAFGVLLPSMTWE